MNYGVYLELVFQIRNTLLDVELPLVENQLNDIDKVLKEAETDLSWESPGNECKKSLCKTSYTDCSRLKLFLHLFNVHTALEHVF